MASANMQNIRFEDARGRSLLVALSGGADSVALLLMLHARQEADQLCLTAAHFHHGIRGNAADGDAAFCRALCARLNLPYMEGRMDVPALARDRKLGLETAARDARYAFLRAAQAQCGADWIALAHHQDDQAETVLMHLLRGAGPEGACGMARLERGLYRPLLHLSKAEIVQFLEAQGQDWREDATNGASDNPRNALRLNVLPEIEKSYPTAARALARYARIARIESDFVAQQAEAFLQERLENLPCGRRLRLDGSEAEALLRRAIRSLAGEIDAKTTAALMRLSHQARGRLEISGGMQVEKAPGWLYFLDGNARPPAEVPLAVPGETIFGNWRIRAEIGFFPLEAENPNCELFDPEALRGAVIRTRRQGDRFHPLNGPGSRLLSDVLTDKKVDRPLRDWLPLAAVGSRIMWICGLGLSETAKVQDPSRRCVRLMIETITDDKTEVEHDQRYRKNPDL